MATSESVVPTIELHPAFPTQWIAIYHLMMEIPAGRWADVTCDLDQELPPTAQVRPSRHGGWWCAARTPITPATPATTPAPPSWSPATPQHWRFTTLRQLRDLSGPRRHSRLGTAYPPPDSFAAKQFFRFCTLR